MSHSHTPAHIWRGCPAEVSVPHGECFLGLGFAQQQKPYPLSYSLQSLPNPSPGPLALDEGNRLSRLVSHLNHYQICPHSSTEKKVEDQQFNFSPQPTKSSIRLGVISGIPSSRKPPPPPPVPPSNSKPPPPPRPSCQVNGKHSIITTSSRRLETPRGQVGGTPRNKQRQRDGTEVSEASPHANREGHGRVLNTTHTAARPLSLALCQLDQPRLCRHVSGVSSCGRLPSVPARAPAMARPCPRTVHPPRSLQRTWAAPPASCSRP